MRHVITSLNVTRLATTLGAIYFALGLIFAPIFLLIRMVGALAGARRGGAGLLMYLVLAVLMPFIYGVIGFGMGALVGFVYNQVAQWLGGIELELKPSPAAATAPPAIPPVSSAPAL